MFSISNDRVCRAQDYFCRTVQYQRRVLVPCFLTEGGGRIQFTAREICPCEPDFKLRSNLHFLISQHQLTCPEVLVSFCRSQRRTTLRGNTGCRTKPNQTSPPSRSLSRFPATHLPLCPYSCFLSAPTHAPSAPELDLPPTGPRQYVFWGWAKCKNWVRSSTIDLIKKCNDFVWSP